jgi:hypothetical protein
VSDLKSFVALQARLYEFLEQQDETTLRAIVSGAVQLAVLRPDDARTPVSSVPREDAPIASGIKMVPTRDPLQAVQDLATLASEQERRIYLNAAKVVVKELREMAKLRGFRGQSKLNREELIDLLVGSEQTKAHADQPRTPAPVPVDSTSNAEQQTTVHETRPSAAASSTEAAKPNADVAAIASRLREAETEEEGATYLRAQHLDRESLLAVAAQLQLTRVDRLSQTELERRVLKQAIGARRKFAGLRKW